MKRSRFSMNASGPKKKIWESEHPMETPIAFDKVK